MSYQLEFRPVFAQFGVLLQGLAVTLELTVVATVIGVTIGTFVSLAVFLRRPALTFVANVYVEVIRNTPFLVQVFIFYFGLAQLGIRFTVITAACLTMAINLGGYSVEILRAGVESVHPSQVEAGLSLGLSRAQVFVDVVLPVAIRNVFPALSSQIVLLMLGSSLCSVIAAPELTTVSSQIGSDTYRYFEVYIVVTLMYLAAALALRSVLALLAMYFFGRRYRAAIAQTSLLAGGVISP